MKKHKSFKKFQDWDALDIEMLLGIPQVNQLPALQQWLNTSALQTMDTHPLLASLREELNRFYRAWNEAELQCRFISPLLHTIHMHGKYYNNFFERKLKVEIATYHVEGTVDFMVASGLYEPEQPYFFLHEYKRFKGTEADPLGQLLIAMIAAQLENNDGLPVYGCFVVGKYWSFVVLAGKEYAVSQGYDATNEQELLIIWNILHHTKIIIEERVQLKLIQQSEVKPLM
jgi:hypothetical protein